MGISMYSKSHYPSPERRQFKERRGTLSSGQLQRWTAQSALRYENLSSKHSTISGKKSQPYERHPSVRDPAEKENPQQMGYMIIFT